MLNKQTYACDPFTLFPSGGELDFHRRQWYSNFLFFSYKRTREEMTYDYHQRVVKKWFKAAGIDSASSTHAFRASGARHATDNLVALSDVAGVARWKRGSMLIHYIHHTPTAAVRVIAGFNKKGNNYALGRSFEAPDLLMVEAKTYVFPWAKAALRQVEQAEEIWGHSGQDHAACKVLHALIKYGRQVVLEDLAALSIKHPNHPYVLQSPLCQSASSKALFASYARNVALHEEAAMRPPHDLTFCTRDVSLYPQTCAS